MILAIIGVIIGFVLLVKGADFFVEGSGSVAKKFNIPVFIIGMTIVAMGTSAPECAVSISASLRGINGMAISNVIGFNLLVVCGVCALFQPLVIKKETLKKEFPFSVLVAVIIGVMGLAGMMVGHMDGIILVVIGIILAAAVVAMIILTKRSKK